jgi:hypothetical protein
VILKFFGLEGGGILINGMLGEIEHNRVGELAIETGSGWAIASARDDNQALTISPCLTRF